MSREPPMNLVEHTSAADNDDEFRLLIAAITDYAILTLSPDGIIRSWNSGAQRLHGYAEQEAVGQYFGVLYPKDGIDVGAAEFQLRFAADSGRHEQEGWQTRKDGSRFWAHSLTFVLRDQHGQLRGFAKVTQDITQRKQAADELRESHTFIQQIITCAQEGIVVYDRNLRYRVFNPYMENFTGLKEKDVLGHQPLEFFPFLTRHGVDLVHQRALRGETLESEPIRYKLGEDHEGWSSGVWSPLRDSQGEIIGAVGFVRDITERIRTQERLQQLSRRLLTAQEQERRRLAIELHDEIGQVLTAVTLNLQSLIKNVGAKEQDQVQDCILVVQEAIQKARELALNLRPSLLDDLGLEPALRWLLDQHAQRAGFTVHLDCHVNDDTLPNDVETAAFRIVQESLTNIVRHARAQAVRVDVAMQVQELRVGVTDDGCGFEIDRVQALAAQGKNLGLLGMQERAELLGGRFSVHSSPGQGTQIEVTFPIEKPLK